MKCRTNGGFATLYFNRRETESLTLSGIEAMNCWVRHGTDWKHFGGYTSILKPQVYWWLKENIGNAMSEVWDIDRVLYPEEIPPEIPKYTNTWAARFKHYEDDSRNWSFSTIHHSFYLSKIDFNHTDHAMLFKLVWGGVNPFDL